MSATHPLARGLPIERTRNHRDASSHTRVTIHEESEGSHEQTAWMHHRHQTVISTPRSLRERHLHALERASEAEGPRRRLPW